MVGKAFGIAAFVVCGLAACDNGGDSSLPDARGTADAGVDAAAVTLDVDTLLDDQPAKTTAIAAATFAFRASLDDATFTCRLDDAAPVPCTSPWTTTVAEGEHVAVITAATADGAVDVTPAIVGWTLDQTAPETSLLLGPGAIDNSATPRFEFTSNEPGVTFECALDGGAFGPCTSPWLVGPLGAGDHAVLIRAVDAAGTPDPIPLAITWTIDLSTPDTVILTAPSGTIGAVASEVTFESPGDAAATFVCAVDGAAFAPCTSPYAIAALPSGGHVVQVQATNAAGTIDPSPATRIWLVDATAPAPTFTLSPASVLDRTAPPAMFGFAADEPSAFTCAVDGGAATACDAPWTSPALGAGPHELVLTATDAYGNAGQVDHAWTIAPETVIDAAPSGEVTVDSAVFEFSSPDGATAFSCVLDGGAAFGCSSGLAVVDLGVGLHTFSVVAIDDAGVADPSPASASWSVQGPPVITFSSTPATPSGWGGVGTFAFSADVPVTFTCQVGTGAVVPCTSPWTVTAPSTGTHPITVRGDDGAGLVGEATFSWVVAAPAWTSSPATPALQPTARGSTQVVYDSGRDRLVMFGGLPAGGGGTYLNDTWEWDGTTWTLRTPATSPPTRIRHVMVYDSLRGVTLLFGGLNAFGQYLSDTWTYDGTTWTQLNPGTSPSAREQAAMVWDTQRGVAVLHGGRPGGGDTWEWNGTTWTSAPGGGGAGSRFAQSLAYDEARHVTVAFGGFSGGARRNDVWEWDGTTWTNRTPVGSPPVRDAAVMFHDPVSQREILFGGGTTAGTLEDTWAWDGTAWTQLAPTQWPMRIPSGLSAAFHTTRGETLVLSGAMGDAWAWDGTTWIDRSPVETQVARANISGAFDAIRGELVWFGGVFPQTNGAGQIDTWRWNGTTWQGGLAPTIPSRRHTTAMAFDAVRGEVVMFGGSNGIASKNDTWAWNGSTWTQRTPATNPPARAGHKMAFDAARGEIVMTGGINDGKTWIWNGTDWAERVTVTPAPDLSGGPLAYDPDHQSVLAYAPNTSRTWRWDGADWSNVTPASMPVARFGAVMVADATEHVVSLIGGVAGGVPTGEHWIWDGSQWSPRAGGGATITYSGTAVFDSVRGEVVVAGGYLAGATLSTRTWLLR